MCIRDRRQGQRDVGVFSSEAGPNEPRGPAAHHRRGTVRASAGSRSSGGDDSSAKPPCSFGGGGERRREKASATDATQRRKTTRRRRQRLGRRHRCEAAAVRVEPSEQPRQTPGPGCAVGEITAQAGTGADSVPRLGRAVCTVGGQATQSAQTSGSQLWRGGHGGRCCEEGERWGETALPSLRRRCVTLSLIHI